MRISDNDIIVRLRKGDHRHFAALVDRYRDRGYSLALRILRSPRDAEEALQDAFVRAWRGLGEFQGSSTFATWFYRILYNVCMTALAKRRKERIFADGGEEDLPDPGAEPAMPGDWSGLELRDLTERVAGALRELPPKYASIITLFHLQELSHAEIAEVTGLPVGTIKTHLFRARVLLQKAALAKIDDERIAV